MTARRQLACVLGATVVACAVTFAADGPTPALYQSGSIPTISPMSAEIGGGEVLVEATVDTSGSVTNVRTLRETAGFTERVTQVVRTWHFSPAEVAVDPATWKPGQPKTKTVESHVLVAGIFRAPALVGPTFGEAVKNVATSSDDAPFPLSIATPGFPPMAIAPGVALVEMAVSDKGEVLNARIKGNAAGFEAAALGAARDWRFRPALAKGSPVASVAYAIFSFPLPK